MEASASSDKSEKSESGDTYGGTHKRKLSETDSVMLSKDVASTSSDISDDENWDVGCRTLPIRKRSKSFIGFNLGSGLQLAEGYLPERESEQINLMLDNSIRDKNFKSNFRTNWDANTDFKADRVELLNKPFKHCIIDNFIENESELHEIRLAYNNLDWNKRKMDMYEFFQSPDLKHISNPYIKNIHNFFKKEVHKLITELTGTKIDKISLTCSFYSYTDYLLLHDDLQRDRAVAFILYMTDPNPRGNGELWTSEMGGNLMLYDTDTNGKPGKVVKKITPRNNRFTFFQVTNESFHQVEEIFNKDHCRYSINGWFHTKEENAYLSLQKSMEELQNTPRCSFEKSVVTNIQLQHWIIGEYLDKSIRRQIQEQMEAESEISLANFFIPEKYEDLYLALQNKDLVWDKVGPLNRNNYEAINTDNLPKIIKNFLLLFRSKKMFKLLRDYTDLDLTDVDETKQATVRIELQRWSPGCYSLMSNQEDPYLDVIFYIGCEKPIVGAETMYVANDTDVESALVSVEPKDNTLDLIYRDTCKFTRYVSYTSQQKCFYTLLCSYKEYK